MSDWSQAAIEMFLPFQIERLNSACVGFIIVVASLLMDRCPKSNWRQERSSSAWKFPEPRTESSASGPARFQRHCLQAFSILAVVVAKSTELNTNVSAV